MGLGFRDLSLSAISVSKLIASAWKTHTVFKAKHIIKLF